MTNLVKHILVLGIYVHMTFATKIGCGNDYVTANWDDDAFKYYFMPSNIEKTLYCIGFDKNRLTNGDESVTVNTTGAYIKDISYPLKTSTKNIIFCTLKKYFTFSSIMNNCTLTKAFINILTKLYSLISQQNMLVTFCQALQLNNGLSMNFLACQFFRLATYMSDHPMVSPSKHVQLSSIHIPSTSTNVQCLSFLVSFYDLSDSF